MTHTRSTQFQTRGAPLPPSWEPQPRTKPVPTARECWAVSPFLSPKEWLDMRLAGQKTGIDRSRVYKLLVESWRDDEYPKSVKPTARDYSAACAAATMKAVRKHFAGDLTSFQMGLLVQCLSGQRVPWPESDEARKLYVSATRAILTSETYAAISCKLGWFPALEPEPEVTADEVVSATEPDLDVDTDLDW